MPTLWQKIFPFISKNILFLMIAAIVLIHSMIMMNYIINHNQAAADRRANNIKAFVFLLTQGARSLKPTAVLSWIQNLNNQDFQLSESKIKLSLSDKPLYKIMGKAENSQAYLSDFSYKMNKNFWLNYQIVSNNKPLVFLVSMTAISIILIALCLFYIFSIQRFSLPLNNFKMSAEKLGIDINVEPIKIFGPQIVQEAANAINQMQARIQELVNKRTQMLASISHDLKTPITRLKLRTYTFEENPESELMLRDLDEMEEMISTILTFSYHDVLREKKSTFEIVSMLSAICENYCDQGHTVNFIVSVESILFHGNRLALKRTLNNLIQNGIKYAGEVDVQLIEDPSSIIILIEDNGSGIPEEELTKVLEPYYRSDDVRFQNKSGSGLGLSIAQEVIAAHHGELILSNREIQGLQVKVILPKRLPE